MTTNAQNQPNTTNAANPAMGGDVEGTYLTTEEAGRRVAVAAKTVRVWIVRGVRLRGGGRLRLRAIAVGGEWRTTAGWVDEFVARTTEDRLGGAPAAPQVEPADARRERFRREAAAAARRLGGGK